MSITWHDLSVRAAIRGLRTGGCRGFVLVLGQPVGADIYQWQWVESADPSQGKMQSSVVCAGGWVYLRWRSGSHVSDLARHISVERT